MGENEPAAESSWANLPGDILYNISGRLTSIIDFKNFRSVCMPWRTKVTVTNMPYFVELDGNDVISSVRCLPNPSWHRFVDRDDTIRFLGSSNGWLIQTSGDPLTCCLYNPFSRSKIELPPRFSGADRIFLSSPPTSVACTALLVGRTRPQFRFCKPGVHSWWQDCGYGYPFFSSNDYLRDVVALERRFYALSLQGYLSVIECVSQHQPITALLSPMKVTPSWPPSWPEKKKYYRYLVESGGKILVVFLLASVHTGHIDEVQVFRLDVPSLSWERVYELDGRILFVGLNSSFSIARTDEWDGDEDVYFPEKGFFLYKSYSLRYNIMWGGLDYRTDLRIQKRGGWMLASLERIWASEEGASAER